MRGVFFGALGAACVATMVAAQVQSTATLNPRDLRPLASFSGIGDQAERSRALFNEIAKVVTHPRCMNCHPAGNHPLQGYDQHAHMPPVPRGEAGLGVAGLPARPVAPSGTSRWSASARATRAFRAMRAGGSRRSRRRGSAPPAWRQRIARVRPATSPSASTRHRLPARCR